MPAENRLQKLRERMLEGGVAALLVTWPPNVRYLSGFTGEGQLVVGQEELLLSTDGRFKGEASKALPGITTCFHENGHLAGAVECLKRLDPQSVGFESENLSYASYQTLSEKLGGRELKPTSKWVEQLRMVKEEEEVAAIREAAAKVDTALVDYVEHLQPGLTEQEMALDLERALVLAGTESAFPIIMASGPSAAQPHAVPGRRRLSEGEMLKIDLGRKVGGYCSDLTRTYFFGEPDEKFVEVYSLVFRAQEAALAAVRPGLSGRDLDKVARDIITEGGYGPQFSHGLGHGVGLQVHEGPRVSAKTEDTLAAGMVITVEPGIYIEGWGGVRIEDLVLITEGGGEVLSKAAKLRL